MHIVTRHTFTKSAAAGIAVAALYLSGCSDIETALNEGGDTPCSEFVKQDANKQRQTITKAIKEQSGNDNEPMGVVVDAGIVSVNLLCQVQANQDTPIKNANLVGAIPR